MTPNADAQWDDIEVLNREKEFIEEYSTNHVDRARRFEIVSDALSRLEATDGLRGIGSADIDIADLLSVIHKQNAGIDQLKAQIKQLQGNLIDCLPSLLAQAEDPNNDGQT